MLRFLIFIFIILTLGCSIRNSIKYNSRSENQFYVSCPPQLFYCYRKSDLICRKDYRVLKVVNKDDNPEMIIDCKK